MSRALDGLVLALGALLALLLLRDAAGIFAAAPYDPNEGWNAVFALRAMAGQPLYPGGWLVNNYPPLSFYAVGALSRLTGNAIVAGRLLSLAAFLGTSVMIGAVARRLGAGRAAAVFGALFFAAALLLASDYVAMDDPQLLGHALQLAALLLLLRGGAAASALLFAASLFVKHNLIALPLAAMLWLLLQDRGAAWRFFMAGLAAGLAGLAAFHAIAGQSLMAQLASPRALSAANFQAVTAAFLAWAGLPLVLAFALLAPARRQAPARLVLCYLVIACCIGLAFAPGDGVDANLFFDAAIALALALALALSPMAPPRGAALAALSVAPLLVLGGLNFHDGNFAYTPRFRAEATANIAFLRNHPGPALCQMLSLCVWAGKAAAVDVFNTGEAFKTGARDDGRLAALLASRHFAVLQLDQRKPFALGPRVGAALERGYRLDHADDNGYFFVPQKNIKSGGR